MQKFNLTPTQREVFDFIDDFIDEKGFAPTYREIAEGCGFTSLSRVTKLMKALKLRGWIDYLPKQNRSITIIGDNT